MNVKVEFAFTDAPQYLTKLVFKRVASTIYIKVRKKNGSDAAEVEIPLRDFLTTVEILSHEKS